MSVVMQAPPTVVVPSTMKLPLTGNSLAIDAEGFVTVNTTLDIIALGLQGFLLLWGGRNTFDATADPVAGNNSSQDYGPGSLMINIAATNNSGSAPRAWMCVSGTIGAAVWIQISVGNSIAGTAEFTNLIVDGLLTGAAQQVTAFSGGGQASATALTNSSAISRPRPRRARPMTVRNCRPPSPAASISRSTARPTLTRCSGSAPTRSTPLPRRPG